MASPNSLLAPADRALSLRASDVYRLGALVLRTLDQLAEFGHDVYRITVYGRRVVVFDLADLPYSKIEDLVNNREFGRQLLSRIQAELIVARPAESGCRLIVDLGGPLPQAGPQARRTRTSLLWCEHCSQLMPYGHTHAEVPCATVC